MSLVVFTFVFSTCWINPTKFNSLHFFIILTCSLHLFHSWITNSVSSLFHSWITKIKLIKEIEGIRQVYAYRYLMLHETTHKWYIQKIKLSSNEIQAYWIKDFRGFHFFFKSPPSNIYKLYIKFTTFMVLLFNFNITKETFSKIYSSLSGKKLLYPCYLYI